jgi:hypothetical protein
MKIIASIFIIFALVVGIVPQFTDCQSQGRAIELANGRTIPMKCHWTGEAEIAVAGPLLLVGGLMWFVKRRESLRVLSILGLALGAFAILLPTALIGVCASADMLCNSVMKPTLIFGGTVVGAASLIGFALASKAEPPMIPAASSAS